MHGNVQKDVQTNILVYKVWVCGSIEQYSGHERTTKCDMTKFTHYMCGSAVGVVQGYKWGIGRWVFSKSIRLSCNIECLSSHQAHLYSIHLLYHNVPNGSSEKCYANL